MEKGNIKQNFRKSGRKKTVAGEDLAAGTPPARILDRAGAHAPAAIARVPESAHSPDVFVATNDIGDVGIAIGEQFALFPMRLLL